MRVETNVRDLIQEFTEFEREQIPYMQMLTVNFLAVDARNAARDVINLEFRSKRKLSNAIKYKKAKYSKGKRASLNNINYAEVYVDDHFRWKENALVTMAYGGDRERKSTERVLQRAGLLKSSEILTTDGGKVSGGVYTKIISQFRLFNKSGFDANETKDSRKRNNAKRGIKSVFFIVTTNHIAYRNNLGKVAKKRTGLAPGIYVTPYRTTRDENRDKVLSRANAKPIRILKIGSKPNYTKRWDLEKIIQTVHNKKLNTHFSKAYDIAMFTSKKSR